MLYSGSGYAFVCKQKRTFILQRRKTLQHSRPLLFNIEMGRVAKLRYVGIALASPNLPEGGRTLFLQTPVSVSDKILFLPQFRPWFFHGGYNAVTPTCYPWPCGLLVTIWLRPVAQLGPTTRASGSNVGRSGRCRRGGGCPPLPMSADRQNRAPGPPYLHTFIPSSLNKELESLFNH